MIELDGELMKLSLISASQSDSEGGLWKIAGRRLSSGMDNLSGLGTNWEIPSHHCIVRQRIELRNCWELATSRLNGSRACRHHKLASNSVK